MSLSKQNNIFTKTNHYLGIKDSSNGLNYYISPIKLDVGQLQFLVDNNKLSIESWIKERKKKQKYYTLNLGANYSAINIETNTEIKETQATSGFFYHIIDENDSDDQKQIKLNLSENDTEKSYITIPIKKKKINSQEISDDEIHKDISYVKSLIEDVKKYLYDTDNPKRKYKELFNNIHGNDTYNYNIVEEQEVDFGDGKETIVYVGYPDMTEMQWLLNKEYIDYTNDKLKERITNYKQELYDFWKKEQLLYSTSEDTKQWDIESGGDIKENYYKMFIELKNHYETTFIDPICNEYNVSDDERKRIKDYYLNKFRDSNLIQNCLNRPNLNIKYIWFIFKKEITTDDTISLTPYFNTVRDLGGTKKKCAKHLHILDTLLTKYIRQELSVKFNILLDDETEYKNYYSYFQYGSIFHIRSDYIYPTQQIDHYTHRLGRTIKLEEVLYTLDEAEQTDVMENYWQKIKLEYYIKGRFLLSDKGKTTKNNITNISKTKKRSTNSTRSTRRQQNHVVNNTNNTNNINNNALKFNTTSNSLNNTLKSITVLICYSISNKSTHIYFKKGNDYYYMKIIPFLTNIMYSSINDFKKLQENDDSSVYKIKVLKKLTSIKLFKKYSYYGNFSIFPSLFIHGPVDREFKITLPNNEEKNLYNFYSPINMGVLNDIKNKSHTLRQDIKYIYSNEISLEDKKFNIIMYRKGLNEQKYKYIVYIFSQNEEISTFLKEMNNNKVKKQIFYDDNKLISIMTYDNNNNIISSLKKEILKIFNSAVILEREKSKYKIYINKLSSLNLSCLHFQLIKTYIYQPVLNSYYQLINRLIDVNDNHNIELYNQYYYKMGLSKYNVNMSLKIMFSTLNNI